MEEKPWYLQIEFWAPMLTALVFFLSTEVGLELNIEHILGIVGSLTVFIWKRIKDRTVALEVFIANKQFEIDQQRISAERAKIKSK